MSYQLVIPMTGKGTRFKSAGYSELKPFIPVAGKPIIQHILGMYPNRTQTLFIVNSSDPELEHHKSILENLSPGCVFAEIADHNFGPSFAIHKAASFISTDLPIIVNYADFAGVWSESDFLQLLRTNDACILTYTGFHPHMLRNTKYAYVKKDGNRVVGIQEKQPYTDQPMLEEASAGAYGFQSSTILLDAIEKQIARNLVLNFEYYTSLTFVPIIEESKLVATLLMYKFYQWGTPEDLEDWKSWHNFFNALETFPGLVSQNTTLTSIILAGGKGNRLKGATSVPKALYLVQGKQLWQHSRVKGEGSSNFLAIRGEYEELVTQEEGEHTNLISIEGDTKGQAATALIALEGCPNESKIINFLSCDNLILDENIFSQVSDSPEETLYVWVTENYENSKNQPKQFSWVLISELGRISHFFPKQNPGPGRSAVVVGNFTFSSFGLASRAIRYCLQQENWINDEAYLDRAIEYALFNDIKVQPIYLEKFRAIGTMNEIQTFEYWSECKKGGYLSWN
jgi:bifunctional N-acetylglucosamine-1-phosphate-uridyltransferase/glucosamine-1-phosphate-acetyltransferase GlmU-like protein